MTGRKTLLPLRSSGDTVGDVSRVLGKLETSGQDVSIARLLANSSSCFRPFVLFSHALLNKSPLPAAVREAVILDIAQFTDNSYEWAEHEAVALRAGLSNEQVAAIRSGDGIDGLLSPDMLLGIAIARQICRSEAIDPAQWDRMVASWGAEAALDLVIAVGWWAGLVPAVLSAFGLTADHVGTGSLA